MSEPAFPCTGEGHGNPQYWTPGLTKREWFAGMALAGMRLKDDGDYSIESHRSGLPKKQANWVAAATYRIADAMIAASKDETL